MTNKSLFILGGIIVALGLGLVIGRSFSVAAPQNFGAIGTNPVENYIPVILYNEGYYSALPIQTTSTITSAGIVDSGTLTVSGTATFSGLASTTQLKVGSLSDSTISGLVFGTCNMSFVSTASSTAYQDCTGAAGVTSSYKVIVQATSSLPDSLVVVAASTTATAGTINVKLRNPTGGSNTSGSGSLNFWAFR